MPLDFSLDFPLDFSLDGCDFGVISQIKALNPLVVTDSALLNSANVGRPIPQRTMRDFNGTTQYATKAVSNYRSGDASGAIEVTFSTTAVITTALFSSADETTNENYMLLGVSAEGTLFIQHRSTLYGNDQVATIDSYNDGLTHTARVTSNGSAYTIEVDGLAVATTIISGTNSGAWFSTTAGLDNISVGVLTRLTSVIHFNGTISDVRIYDPSGEVVNQWELVENGGSTMRDALGVHGLTYINNPVVTTDNTAASDPLNERGVTERTGFDGTSYLTNPVSNYRSGDASGAIEVTFSTTSTSNQVIFSASDDLGDFNFFGVGMFDNGSVYIQHRELGLGSGSDRVATVDSYNDGLTHTARVTSNGSSYTIEVDGVVVATTTSEGSNSGKWLSTMTELDNISVGVLNRLSIVAYFDGIISDVRVYDPSNTLVNEWIGHTNTDAAWQDQVGSLDMTRVNTYNAYLVARLDTPAIDVGGNATQWANTAYPVLPNITGGTAEAFTALNTNVADDGNQTPAILRAGLPATWTQGDANTPRFQVRDNGDSTSSLALGLPADPTPAEQISIDKYHG